MYEAETIMAYDKVLKALREDEAYSFVYDLEAKEGRFGHEFEANICDDSLRITGDYRPIAHTAIIRLVSCMDWLSDDELFEIGADIKEDCDAIRCSVYNHQIDLTATMTPAENVEESLYNFALGVIRTLAKHSNQLIRPKEEEAEEEMRTETDFGFAKISRAYDEEKLEEERKAAIMPPQKDIFSVETTNAEDDLSALNWFEAFTMPKEEKTAPEKKGEEVARTSEEAYAPVAMNVPVYQEAPSVKEQRERMYADIQKYRSDTENQLKERKARLDRFERMVEKRQAEAEKLKSDAEQYRLDQMAAIHRAKEDVDAERKDLAFEKDKLDKREQLLAEKEEEFEKQKQLFAETGAVSYADPANDEEIRKLEDQNAALKQQISDMIAAAERAAIQMNQAKARWEANEAAYKAKIEEIKDLCEGSSRDQEEIKLLREENKRLKEECEEYQHHISVLQQTIEKREAEIVLANAETEKERQAKLDAIAERQAATDTNALAVDIVQLLKDKGIDMERLPGAGEYILQGTSDGISLNINVDARMIYAEKKVRKGRKYAKLFADMNRRDMRVNFYSDERQKVMCKAKYEDVVASVEAIISFMVTLK